MNCENIHKKHTGSHLSKFLKQESWFEIQFESLYYRMVKCSNKTETETEIIVKTLKKTGFLTNSFFFSQFLLIVSLLHLLSTICLKPPQSSEVINSNPLKFSSSRWCCTFSHLQPNNTKSSAAQEIFWKLKILNFGKKNCSSADYQKVAFSR